MNDGGEALSSSPTGAAMEGIMGMNPIPQLHGREIKYKIITANNNPDKMIISEIPLNTHTPSDSRENVGLNAKIIIIIII